MPNQYVNKVAKSDGTVLLDLSQDTVTSAAHIMSGYIGHLADGSQVTGTGSGGSVSISDESNSTGTTCVITSNGSSGGSIDLNTIVIPQQTINASTTYNIISSYLEELIIGEQYICIFDDVEYGPYYGVDSYGAVAVGDVSNNGWKFEFDRGMFLTVNDTSLYGTHTIKVEKIVSSNSKHTIRLEFTDSTNTTIDAYYDDSLISTMITSYTPLTYNNKTVALAQLDNVTWYERETITWETIFNATVTISANPPEEGGGYAWISQLASYEITNGSIWRITYKNVEYVCTAYYDDTLSPRYGYVIGGDQTSGLSEIIMNPSGWGAWILNTSETSGSYSLKVERPATS